MPGVSKEQIAQARAVDLFGYLQIHEPDMLKRDGYNYRHAEHDSLVYVASKKYWYWNSRGRSINALDYLIEIRGYNLVGAVEALTGGGAPVVSFRSPAFGGKPQPVKKYPFRLPWVRRCATYMVSYLQQRGIDTEVISRCSSLGLLYESKYKGEEVCVFVGKDDDGKAKFAAVRSIAGDLKKDIAGSDKQYSFCLPPKQPQSRHVTVFEAPIDALSHATLQRLEGWQWDGYRLSLAGTSHVALIGFLERHPEIYRVTLCLDNDKAGLINARKIKAMLREDSRFRHIRVSISPPRKGKDYNEKLQITRQQMRERHQPSRQQAAISI